MSASTSLLDFLASPVVVGDPEGRVVYVNASFELRFAIRRDEAQGETLASLFAGGAREAILKAVSQVCGGSEVVNFRLREGGRDYLGVASPIEAESDAVGVLILLTDEPAVDRRLIAFHREIQEPLDEVAAVMENLIDQTGGRRSERFRGLLEDGMASLERARKWSGQVLALLTGEAGGVGSARSFDPVLVLREAAARVEAQAAESDCELELLFPASLPAASGDAALLDTVLVRVLRQRLGELEPGGRVTLMGRRLPGTGAEPSLLITVADRGDLMAGVEGVPVSEAVFDMVAILGGKMKTVQEPGCGRATGLRLPLAASGG